jgi:hypothetical protein
VAASQDTSGTGQRSIRHYFVDEAGDGVLFDRDGAVTVATPGCSRFFMLGVVDVPEPQQLDRDLTALRGELLSDHYLSRIASMQMDAGKTARCFHATDDCPEVRLEVFRLLMRHELKFFAVVRDKRVIAERVREHNRHNASYRYHPDQLYDRCVSRLFRDRLHKDDGYTIHFATRGSRSRTAALQASLEQARSNFRYRHGIQSSAPVEIIPACPADAAGLQAVDYFLWALQRLYERKESRYFDFIASAVALVHDVDDTRRNAYGEYYTKKTPLLRDKLGE